ncbi:MAG: micrococcal nuclease [Patescibacteria group bacterium]|nr:micrococcal nuclease [Patescibacteria group bacterium]
MKKILIITVSSLIITSGAFAHPGGLDQNGGHYCRTKCAKYGLKTGQYHCHRSYCKLK